MSTVLVRLIAFAVLWYALTQGDGLWYYGIPVVAAVTIVSVLIDRPRRRQHHPVVNRLRAGAAVGWWFTKYSVTGTIDVARRVIGRRLDIDPAEDHVDLRLQSPVGRVLLSTLGSLTPGSLSVALTDDGLDIHLLHRDMSSRAQLLELEEHLLVLFDPPTPTEETP